MAPSATVLSVIVMAAILGSVAATKVVNPVHRDTHMAEFIKTSCNVTMYPQVCVSSLSSYAGTLKPKQSDIVNAAVQVSLVNAHNVSVWATGLKTRRTTMSKREKSALKDCMQNFQTTTDQIHQSLAELKHLKRNTFKLQMSNVETWMSASLTNQDSCLDGFKVAKGRVKGMVTGRVHYLCKLISNALALVNKFAATKGGYKIDV